MRNLGPWKVAMQRMAAQYDHPVNTAKHPLARYYCLVKEYTSPSRIRTEMRVGGFRTVRSSAIPLKVLREEIYEVLEPLITTLLEDKAITRAQINTRLISELNSTVGHGVRLGDVIVNKLIHEYPEYSI